MKTKRSRGGVEGSDEEIRSKPDWCSEEKESGGLGLEGKTKTELLSDRRGFALPWNSDLLKPFYRGPSVAICCQIRQQNLIPVFFCSWPIRAGPRSQGRGWRKDRGEGQNFLFLSAESRRGHKHKQAQYKKRHTGDLTRIINAAFFEDTAADTFWLQELQICHQNQFSCLFLCTRLYSFWSLYPALKAFAAFLCCINPTLSPLSSSTSVRLHPTLLCFHLPFYVHCKSPSSVPQLCRQSEFTAVHLHHLLSQLSRSSEVFWTWWSLHGGHSNSLILNNQSWMNMQKSCEIIHSSAESQLKF